MHTPNLLSNRHQDHDVGRAVKDVNGENGKFTSSLARLVITIVNTPSLLSNHHQDRDVMKMKNAVDGDN